MFVRSLTNKAGKVYTYVLHSVYDKTKKRSVHKRLANLTGLPQAAIDAVKAVLEGRPPIFDLEPAAISIAKSRLLGPLWIALIFWLRLRLDKAAFLTRSEFRSLTAMVVGRVVNPVACRSERRTAEWLCRTAAGLLIAGNAERSWNRNAFYPVLTKLSENWDKVERTLWENRSARPNLYLYDITSTYFEGRGGSMGKFGYSRDERKGNPQVVVALVADENGVPVALRILPGNTRDSSTVVDMAKELRETFGVDRAVVIMDRGMRAEANIDYLLDHGVGYIMALKHKEAREFLARNNDLLEWELFDERNLAEWTENGKRYVICKNPGAAVRDRHTRERIMQKAEIRLEGLVTMAEKGRVKDRGKIIARAAKILTQTNTEKYFDYEAETGSFKYWRKKERLAMEEDYEGCYVIETTLEENEADKTEVDASYRNQREIEEVFKSCKDELHLRPNFHVKDENILGHIRLTFLAHLVKKHLELVLRSNGRFEKGSTFLMGFDNVMINDVAVKGESLSVISELDEKQRAALEDANLKMPTGQMKSSLDKHLPKSLQGII